MAQCSSSIRGWELSVRLPCQQGETVPSRRARGPALAASSGEADRRRLPRACPGHRRRPAMERNPRSSQGEGAPEAACDSQPCEPYRPQDGSTASRPSTSEVRREQVRRPGASPTPGRGGQRRASWEGLPGGRPAALCAVSVSSQT